LNDLNTDKWFLGVDLGTGSCKTVVINSQGCILGFGASDYQAQDVNTKWQEQNPDAILDGMISSIRKAISTAGISSPDCAGLSLSGALHNFLAIDQNNKPLTGVFTWADTRCADQVHRTRQSPQAAEIYQNTGCPVHTIYGLYKIIWLRETRPDLFNRVEKFISVKEYIYYHLTDTFKTDYGLASGNSLLNIHTLSYDAYVLELAEISENQLSPLFPPETTHPGVNPAIAAKIGISPNTTVILGTSDAANSSLGAGAVDSTQATLSVGTSGAYRVISAAPKLDENGRSWCYAMDTTHWLVGGAINNAGFSLSWWREAINQILPAGSHLSFDEIIRKAETVDAGANGLICLPFFTGERSPYWNPDARGVLFGLGLEHDTRHISRAVLEGVALSFRSLDEILSSIGFEIKEVCASGGFTKSPFWLQIMASALNRQITVPDWGETAAYGASLWTLLSAGLIDKIESGANFVQTTGAVKPDPVDARLYSTMFEFYKKLYLTLESTFDELTNQ